MKPEFLQAIDVLVAHAMKTAIADLWPHIKVLMDGVLLPALEAQKAAAQAAKDSAPTMDMHSAPVAPVEAPVAHVEAFPGSTDTYSEVLLCEKPHPMAE
jgi:hypothetical protein